MQVEKHNDIMTWFKQATIEEIDKEIIRKYCFVKNRHEEKLAIGSPSSPDISNIVMRVVDVALVEMATSFEGKYTRYADDIIERPIGVTPTLLTISWECLQGLLLLRQARRPNDPYCCHLSPSRSRPFC